MSSLPARAEFACCECGSPSITLPADLADDAPVSCGGCDSFIGSWLGYKCFVSRSIGREMHGLAHAPLICVDPIMMHSFEDLPVIR